MIKLKLVSKVRLENDFTQDTQEISKHQTLG